MDEISTLRCAVEGDLMPYARLDDRWDDHQKIRKAWRTQPAAVALHAMAITYCNRHNNNGSVDADWVAEKLALLPYKPAARARILETLIELRLLEPDGDDYLVHDFLDWNLSREQRAALSEQGRRGGRAKAINAGHTDPDGSGPRSSQGLSDGSGEPGSHGSSGGSSTPRHATPRQESLRSNIVELFDYWRSKCRHPTSKLTPERRKKIEGRLRDGYTSEQIRSAIDGAAVGAFVNDAGKRFDDIELICRNGSKLESFIGRRGGDVVPIGRRESPSDLLRALNGGEAS